nr:adenylyl-sulfate kinase [Methanocella sp. CWC-04]
MTGLPGSGKTSVARQTAKRLSAEGIRVKVLELDKVRKVMTPEPKYTQEERDMAYAALAYMAKLLVEENVNVIIDATANLRKYRDAARKLIPQFGEVYIKCPIEICMEREKVRHAKYAPRDIYKKGLTGKSATVPGVNVPYEEPADPIVTVDTEIMKPNKAGIVAAEAIIKRFGMTDERS